jgi:hypothetical protein
MAVSSAQRAQKHEQRLDWLRARPELLTRLPGAKDDVDAGHADALDEALRGMKLARLFAPTTTPGVTRWGIRLAVSEIRGERVTGQDPRYQRGR